MSSSTLNNKIVVITANIGPQEIMESTIKRQDVYANQLNILIEAIPQSVAVNLVVAVIVVSIHIGQVKLLPLLSWLFIFGLVMGGRLYLYHRYHQAGPSSDEQYRLWRKNLFIITTLSGLLWGGAQASLLLQGYLAHLDIGLIVIAGLAAGALTAMAADFLIYAGYAGFILIPPIAAYLFLNGSDHLTLAALLCLLLIFLLLSAKRLNDSIIASLHLRYENRDLLKALEEEKIRLGSRFARVLNDLATEIYIIDTESLAILQTNAGAARNLGYNMVELRQLRFTDINPQLNREGFTALVAGWREGNHTPLTIQGEHRRKNGTSYPIEARIQVSNKETPPVCVITAVDDSERHLYEERLLRQANYSELTGLPNKKMALGHIAMAMGRSDRSQNQIALLFLDLDNFKNINDSLGHAAGDELLRQVAQRLAGTIRKTDTAAHLSGDEFLIILEDLNESSNATSLTNKIFATLALPYTICGRDIFLTASIGISIFPDHGENPEQLLQQADTAMYSAKAAGKNNFQYFSQAMNDALTRHLQIEAELHQAIAGQRFEVYFQPLCETASCQPIAAEALLRWNSELLGMVSPAEFIPVAEHSDLIVEIGTWVLHTACREAAGWPEKEGQRLRVAVNLSPRQFRAPTLIESITGALSSSGLPPHLLELEITESLLMQNLPELQDKIMTLRKMGIRFSLDDFGTGYSSLSYLKRFPIQTLKIDRSFINNLENDINDQYLVSAIINMGHSLNLEVVAEGVENPGQLGYLMGRGVDLIQGYLISRPLPARDFRAYLATNNKATANVV